MSQLILEKKDDYAIDDDLLEQIFACIISDFSQYALKMVLDYENSPQQEEIFKSMMTKPNKDKERFDRVFNEQVMTLKDSYKMRQ